MYEIDSPRPGPGSVPRSPRPPPRMNFLTLISCLCLSLTAVAMELPNPADQGQSARIPTPRTDKHSQRAHELLVEKARRGGIDLYFVGDSITRRWGATDNPAFLAHWKKNFFG